MDRHDEAPGELSPDRAALQALLRGIPLAAEPADKDTLLWSCGHAAGRAEASAAVPREHQATRGVRFWLPLAGSTAAAFLVGVASAGAFSSGARPGDATRQMTGASPPVDVAATVPDRVGTRHPAPVSRPRSPAEGLSATMPLHRIDDILATSDLPPIPAGFASPPDRPPLRVRSGRAILESFDL